MVQHLDSLLHPEKQEGEKREVKKNLNSFDLDLNSERAQINQ